MYCLSFKDLTSAFEFASKPHDLGGSSRKKTEADEWTDNYSFDAYIKDFYDFSNRNKREPQIQEVTRILKKYILEHRHHFIPQNIFEEYSDCSGSIVDVQKYIQNDPECMVNFGDQKVKKNVNIVFQLAGACVQCEQIYLTGIIMYCLYRILKNRIANVYAHVNIEDGVQILVPVIQSSITNLTPHVELALLNTKAFFRRVVFSILESLPAELRERHRFYLGRGYGSTSLSTCYDIAKYFNIHADILINSEYYPPWFELNNYSIETVCSKIVTNMVNILKN